MAAKKIGSFKKAWPTHIKLQVKAIGNASSLFYNEIKQLRARAVHGWQTTRKFLVLATWVLIL